MTSGLHLSRYDCFCVYSHKNPETGKIRYIGMGSPARAYNVSGRSEEHGKWIQGLLEDGHSLWDIVEILHKDLTKYNAQRIEGALIRQNIRDKSNLFNQMRTSVPTKRPNRIGNSGPEEGAKYKKRCWN